MPIDPILSFVVAGILAWGGWRLVHETTLELMEAVPQELDSDAIALAMQTIEGVIGTHHIHLWRLPEGKLAISAHIRINDMEQWPALMPVLLEILKRQNIDHATLQPEVRCYDDVPLSDNSLSCINGCYDSVRKGE